MPLSKGPFLNSCNEKALNPGFNTSHSSHVQKTRPELRVDEILMSRLSEIGNAGAIQHVWQCQTTPIITHYTPMHYHLLGCEWWRMRIMIRNRKNKEKTKKKRKTMKNEDDEDDEDGHFRRAKTWNDWVGCRSRSGPSQHEVFTLSYHGVQSWSPYALPVSDRMLAGEQKKHLKTSQNISQNCKRNEERHANNTSLHISISNLSVLSDFHLCQWLTVTVMFQTLTSKLQSHSCWVQTNGKRFSPASSDAESWGLQKCRVRFHVRYYACKLRTFYVLCTL